ncbi:MAG: hypoxanthine phosphoribosyltransferase [Actinobacteria bacterium]|nr:hypoxanthine phosphoribosyltransferase [Actinomycetota bacterium]
MPLAEIVHTSNEIDQRVRSLAGELEASLQGKRPLLISVLKGSVIFLADLARHLTIEPDIDFISISSYQADKGDQTGVVRIVKDLEEPLEGREVVLVEDILDTGLSLAYLLRSLETRNPSSIKVCTLVDKTVRRIVDLEADYVGFETEDYLIGYGLDFKGRYRNLPFIAAVPDIAALASEPLSLEWLFRDGG